MTEEVHAAETAIHAVGAQELDRGFRLLVLREFPIPGQPPAFAWIEQSLMRSPARTSRHGLWFAAAFLPEIVVWLSDELGRPSLHDSAGRPYRNPRWPSQAWSSEERFWPGGARTLEWSISVTFDENESWTRFQLRWAKRLRVAPRQEEIEAT